MSEQLQRAGQFVLDMCSIHTSAGHTFALKEGGNVLNITFKEDISTPFVNGDLVFHNSGSLSTLGPIIGQETLELRLRTPTMTDPKETLDFTGNNRLYITRVNSRRHIGKDTEVLSVHFISSEWVRNTATRISKTLEGNISSIVFRLLDDVGCQKLRQIEPSAELKKFIAPNMRPFDIIRLLTPQAISSNGTKSSNSYMFFENKQGYHFRSLNSMINGSSAYGIGKDADILHYRPLGKMPTLKNGMEDPTKMLENIIDYETTHNDLMERNTLGHLGSEVISHNIYTKSYNNRVHNYLSDFHNSIHVYNDKEQKEGYPLYSASKDIMGGQIGQRISKTFLQPDYSNQEGKDTGFTNEDGDYRYDGYSADSWLPDRESQFGLLLKGLTVKLKVHGNTFTNAGDIVRITVPHHGVKDARNTKNLDKFFSGRFMIQSIFHEFNVETFTHHMDLRCTKDSIGHELEHLSEGTPEGDQIPTHREVYEDFYL